MPKKIIPAMKSLAKAGRSKSKLPISEQKSLRPGVKIAIGLATIGVVAASRKREKNK